MKTIKLLVFAIVAFYFSGCKDELFDLKFNMPTMEAKYTLKAKDTAGVIILAPTVINLNLDSMAAANGTDLSKLKSLKAKKITVMIESPATANFDILESGFINISTGIEGDPDFSFVRLAEISNVPKGVNTFDIIPADVDLLVFAKKPRFTVSGELVTNGPLLEDIVLKVIIESEVIANPIKK